MSCDLSPKRSASVTLPDGESKTYFFSTFSQGSSRRWLASSSRRRVSCFSFARNSFRAVSHSEWETTLGVAFATGAVAISLLLLFRSDDQSSIVEFQEFECEGADGAGGDGGCDQERG